VVLAVSVRRQSKPVLDSAGHPRPAAQASPSYCTAADSDTPGSCGQHMYILNNTDNDTFYHKNYQESLTRH